MGLKRYSLFSQESCGSQPWQFIGITMGALEVLGLGPIPRDSDVMVVEGVALALGFLKALHMALICTLLT